MEVKVRHALVNFQVKGTDALGNDRMYDEIGLRGQVIDIPDAQARKLMAVGAVIAPDAELDRVGVIMQLPESPTEEEIINWTAAATAAEIANTVAARPELAPRIAGARIRLEENYRRQQELLGGAADRSDALQGAMADADAPPGDPDAADGDPDGDGDDPDATIAERLGWDPDDVVKGGNANEVAAFIADNPEHAQLILDAEVRHTAGKPRNAVVRAAEVAAGHVAR